MELAALANSCIIHSPYLRILEKEQREDATHQTLKWNLYCLLCSDIAPQDRSLSTVDAHVPAA